MHMLRAAAKDFILAAQRDFRRLEDNMDRDREATAAQFELLRETTAARFDLVHSALVALTETTTEICDAQMRPNTSPPAEQLQELQELVHTLARSPLQVQARPLLCWSMSRCARTMPPSLCASRCPGGMRPPQDTNIPQDWLTALIAAVRKPRKDASVPKNYRAIGLESCVLKTLTLLIDRRLRAWADATAQLPEEQTGFRRKVTFDSGLATLRMHARVPTYSRRLAATSSDCRDIGKQEQLPSADLETGRKAVASSWPSSASALHLMSRGPYMKGIILTCTGISRRCSLSHRRPQMGQSITKLLLGRKASKSHSIV